MSAGSVLIAGVGGQGVLLASDLLAAVCLGAGLDVKKSEVHGMAQRGGIVISHVRFGPTVHSPLVEEGQADALVALEWAESLRWSAFLRPGGALVVDPAQIVPPVALGDRRTWTSRYPSMVLPSAGGRGLQLCLIPARELAKAAGAARAANVVLLGALSTRLDFPAAAWEEAIRRLVPAAVVEANLRAFAAGRKADPLPLPPPAPVAAPGGERRFTVAVLSAWCKGCDICVQLCPEGCLQLDPLGVVRVTAPQRCTGCRLCELLCPDFAITVREEGGVAVV